MSEQDPSGGRDLTRNEVSGTVVGNVVQAHNIGSVTFTVGASPAPTGAPRQLLPQLASFVDRGPQFSALSASLTASEDQAAGPRIFMISGLPGVGKAALGMQWAHSVAERFPDGQLYADLRAVQHDGSIDVGDVLHGFLSDLGVHEEWIPASLERRAALFRTKTADLKVFIMVAGARYPAQVEQLVPSSPASALLVTTEHRIGGLLDYEVVDLELQPLDAEAGLLLLRRRVGDGRVDVDLEAAGRLVELCGGLPIALRAAASYLATHPRRPLRRLVDELEDPSTRLARLDVGTGHSVSVVFDAAVRGLSASAAHAYRLISLHPGPDISVWAAAALLEVSSEVAGDLLDELIQAGLVDEDEDGRYHFHGLVRLHAREYAEAMEEPAARLGAVSRIVTWYLAQAYRADWIALGARLRVGGAPYDSPSMADRGGPAGDDGPLLRSDVDALDWLDAERANLLAVQRLAAERGFDEAAWRLCEPLWPLFLSRKHYADWVDSHEVARDAAARRGELVGEAQARKQLAAAFRELGRLEEATVQAQAALELTERAGHERLRASVLEAIGKLRLARGELVSAQAAFEESRQVNLRLGNPRGVLLQENLLGLVLLREGRNAEAYELLSRVSVGIAAFDERNQARVRLNLARAAGALGRDEEAAGLFGQTAEQYRRRGEPSGEIRALTALVDLAWSGDDGARQLGYLQRIIELYEDGSMGERAEPFRRRLSELTS